MIAALFLAFTQVAPAPVSVTIKNPSFEESVPSQYQHPCELATYIVPPSWTSASGTVAVITPLNPRSCDYSNPPDGNKMIEIQNGSVSQDLGDVYTILPHDANGEVNGVYTLRFYVANYFYWYPGKYSASLSLRNPDQVLCKSSGWGMGDFQELTLVCPSQRKYGELILMLASGSGTGEPSGNGYENLFDKVSLTFTPTN